MVTKEESINAYQLLYLCVKGSDEVRVFKKLIDEHFDNPPLKWEELKEGMWIWDSKECEYIFIDRLWISDSNKKMMIYKGLESQVKSEFIEDRFYRKEVQE